MELRDLFPAAITFVALGVLISFGLSVQTSVRSTIQGTPVANCGLNSTGGTTSPTYTACGSDYNASSNAILANANVSSNLPILGTITIAAIVVGVLIRSFTLG